MEEEREIEVEKEKRMKQRQNFNRLNIRTTVGKRKSDERTRIQTKMF